MDRNQLTGLLLIFLMLLVYFQFIAPKPEELPEVKNKISADSLAAVRAAAPALPASDQALSDSALKAKYSVAYGEFTPALRGEEKEIVLENKDIRVTLSTLGGKITSVLLKNYKTYDQKPLLLTEKNNSSCNLQLPTAAGNIDLSKLYFVSQNASATSAAFRLEVAQGRFVEQTYSLGAEGFTLDYDLKVNGISLNQPARLVWQERLKNFEKDPEQSRNAATINYLASEGFDNLSATASGEEKEDVTAVKWVSFKQKFFNMALVSEGAPFEKGEVRTNITSAISNNYIKTAEATLFIPAAELSAGKANFKYYFGPNQYSILKATEIEDFSKNVELGLPVINWINRFVVIPVFHFLEKSISNYGIIIIILVLLIKLVLFPLSYKSYVSMAKMKVLKPELDEIKEKHGDDMAAAQQDQMKLYSQVGVSPFSGCIPLLLQMPVLLAMFNFFPNSIELRQQAFLWAGDLSVYDSILDLPFKIPSYGSHVSLFTILMTASTLVLTWFNNQTSTVAGPMQYMSYIMPVVFMFILNSLPAGLSFYYLVSNVVSIGQQMLIRNFVDEGAIRRKLDETREKNANKPKSSFQQRIEQAMRNADQAKKSQK